MLEQDSLRGKNININAKLHLVKEKIISILFQKTVSLLLPEKEI